MFDACYHQKESNTDVHQEGRRFKVNVQIFLVNNGVRDNHRLVAAVFMKVAHFV